MQFRGVHRARLAMAVAVLAGGGCGGDDTTAPATEGFTVAVASANVAILSGSTSAGQLTVSRFNGFTGNVELIAENVPSGLDVVLPASVSISRPTVPFNVVAQFGATGPRTFTIRAKAPGRIDDTVQVNVVIAGEAPRQYALQLSLTQITIQRGLTNSVVLTISRNPGFTSAVPFECAHVPDGVNIYPMTAAGEFNNPVSGYSATILISVSPAVYATTYFLKCYGLVEDVAVEDVDLRLVVVPPPLLPTGRGAERGN